MDLEENRGCYLKTCDVSLATSLPCLFRPHVTVDHVPLVARDSCSFTLVVLVDVSFFSSYWPAPSTCPALLLRAPHRVPRSCLHRRTVGTDIFSDVESRAFNVMSLSQSHTGTLRAPGAVTDYSFHRVKLSPRRKAVPELCCLALHVS